MKTGWYTIKLRKSSILDLIHILEENGYYGVLMRNIVNQTNKQRELEMRIAQNQKSLRNKTRRLKRRKEASDGKKK